MSKDNNIAGNQNRNKKRGTTSNRDTVYQGRVKTARTKPNVQYNSALNKLIEITVHYEQVNRIEITWRKMVQSICLTPVSVAM